MGFSNATLAEVFWERYGEELGWEIAAEFGEPGYDCDGPIVIGTTTCRCGHNPLAGKHKPYPTDVPHDERPVYGEHERHYIEDHHPLAYRAWEYNGGVWPHDEWMVDDRTGKAWRTQPDSYCWQPSVIYDDDGGYLTPDDDIETWVAWAVNDDRRCLMGDLYDGSDLEEAGFTKWNPEHEGSWRGREGTYETGWHSGQNDSPAEVTEQIRDRHGDDVDIVFVLDEQSQFYAVWSAYTRPVERG